MSSKLERLEIATKLEKSGNWQEMLILCEEWASDEPQDPDAWLGIGNSLRKLGNPAEAILTYLKGLERAPFHVEDSTGEFYDAAPLWYQLGHAYNESGSPHKAVEAFLEAVSIDPDVAEIWNDLGVIYINMIPRETKAAFDAFSKAFDLDPRNVNILKNLGVVYAMCDSEQGVHQIFQLLSNLDKSASENFLLQAKEILSHHK
ncbi:tetratricopeptide repeat protein [Thiobacillus sp.]